MSDPVVAVIPLGFPWQTLDPFLFCAYHDDAYPRGNDRMGPEADLAGRRLGMDFEVRDGWRMYHGQVVPGFPQHPHRGFETITLARRGTIDHSDSLGATARFGHGDVQWMTAGRGIVHSEMFPLLHRDRDNPTELFQLWLNLPAANKLVEPHFTMLWADRIPRLHLVDDAGRSTDIVVVAGELDGRRGPPPPPSSWASSPDSAVAVWTVRMDAGARWTLPAAQPGTTRVAYVFRGQAEVAGRSVPPMSAVQLDPTAAVELHSGPEETELLVLCGRPIGEPVAHHGPFVMNTRSELEQAYADYRRTQFGGWPWPSDAPVHPRDAGRFAVHADGRREEPQVTDP